MKRNKKPTKTVGYGYVGQWRDGDIGWGMCDHVRPLRRRKSGRLANTAEPPCVRAYTGGETAFLCRITIEPVKAKDGRRITRKFKRPTQPPSAEGA